MVVFAQLAYYIKYGMHGYPVDCYPVYFLDICIRESHGHLIWIAEGQESVLQHQNGTSSESWFI